MEWKRSIVDHEKVGVIKEVMVKMYNGPDGLDSVIVSSREGAIWLYYESGSWNRQPLSIGPPKDNRQEPNSVSLGSDDH